MPANRQPRTGFNQASQIKRHRASKVEIERRRESLFEIVSAMSR